MAIGCQKYNKNRNWRIWSDFTTKNVSFNMYPVNQYFDLIYYQLYCNQKIDTCDIP